MGMVEIIRGVERRRRWSVEEKLAIVAEADAAGSTVSGTARRHGLHPNQLFKWRRDVRLGHLAAPFRCVVPRSPEAVAGAAGFARVAVADDGEAALVGSGARGGVVEVVLGNGRMLRVCEDIDPERLARLVSALDGRPARATPTFGLGGGE